MRGYHEFWYNLKEYWGSSASGKLVLGIWGNMTQNVFFRVIQGDLCGTVEQLWFFVTEQLWNFSLELWLEQVIGYLS